MAPMTNNIKREFSADVSIASTSVESFSTDITGVQREEAEAQSNSQGGENLHDDGHERLSMLAAVVVASTTPSEARDGNAAVYEPTPLVDDTSLIADILQRVQGHLAPDTDPEPAELDAGPASSANHLTGLTGPASQDIDHGFASGSTSHSFHDPSAFVGGVSAGALDYGEGQHLLAHDIPRYLPHFAPQSNHHVNQDLNDHVQYANIGNIGDYFGQEAHQNLGASMWGTDAAGELAALYQTAPAEYGQLPMQSDPVGHNGSWNGFRCADVGHHRPIGHSVEYPEFRIVTAGSHGCRPWPPPAYFSPSLGFDRTAPTMTFRSGHPRPMHSDAATAAAVACHCCNSLRRSCSITIAFGNQDSYPAYYNSGCGEVSNASYPRYGHMMHRA